MTVEPAGYDEDCTGSAAAVHGEGEDAVCHAVVSTYPRGELVETSECGIPVDGSESSPRGDFIGKARMCPACWPDHVVEKSE